MGKPGTILAFDYGLKWIGCAVGQSVTNTANPLPALKARDGIPDWQAVEKLLKEWRPQSIVVGQPLNMDGSESPMSARALKFARRLEGRFNIPFAMQDERLSSFDARGELLAQGGNQNFKERGVDSLSAVLILESWFREQAI